MNDSRPLKERILSGIEESDLKHPDGNAVCWNWKRGKISSGYGAIFVNGKQQLAHRISYIVFKGNIPKGLVIDHLCRNPKCVNPLHLEPVTARENLLRGAVSFSTCKRGHEWTEKNTGFQPSATAIGGKARFCWECRRTTNRLNHMKKRYGA